MTTKQQIVESEELILKGTIDSHKGYTIEGKQVEDFTDDEVEFRSQLSSLEQQLIKRGVRNIQIKFKPPKCQLMNAASLEGFYFHHALPQGYVLMCKWIDSRCANRIPDYPHHYIGVGGLCVNKKNEILLI